MAEKQSVPLSLIPLATNSRYSNRSFIRLSQARGLESAVGKEPLCAGRCLASADAAPHPVAWKASFVLRIAWPDQCALLLEDLCTELKTGSDTFIAERGYKKDEPTFLPSALKELCYSGWGAVCGQSAAGRPRPTRAWGSCYWSSGGCQDHIGPLTCGRIHSTPWSWWIATVIREGA